MSEPMTDMSQSTLLPGYDLGAPASPAALIAARRLRLARLGGRISRSLERLVRAEQQARARLRQQLEHPEWTDRMRTR